MRIAQFIDTFSRGGAETVIAELSLALRRAGHEPLVLHFGNPFLDGYCRKHGIEQRIAPAHRSYKSTRTLPAFAASFARFLRRERIDLLHAHLFGPVTAAALAGRLAGIRTVGTLHDVYSIEEKPARIRLLQAAALLGCRIITVSRHMQALYRRFGRFPAGQLQTIYNGVALPTVAPAQISALRASLGLPENARVVVTVGRLVELKRHDVLIRAVREIPAPRPIYLLCAGDGPCLDALRRLTTDLEMTKNVVFLGERDDVSALLALADVFALGSDTEGLSCSILEAMASGTPAVVTDVGGNRELVTDGDNGYLVPAGDWRGMAARLQQLLDDPTTLARMGAASATRARELFSFDAMTGAYLRQYGLSPRGRPDSTQRKLRTDPSH